MIRDTLSNQKVPTQHIIPQRARGTSRVFCQFLMLVSTDSVWGRFRGPTDPKNDQNPR